MSMQVVNSKNTLLTAIYYVTQSSNLLTHVATGGRLN